MRKKIIISICATVLILFSFSLYKYFQLNNNKLNTYADRVLWLAINTQNSIYAITEASPTEEDFNRNVEDLIINVYALQNVLESGEILLSGNGVNGSALYNSLDNLESVLKYDSSNLKNIELDAINSASDVLIQRLQPHYGSEKNISKKEILEAIQLALMKMKIIELLH
ncbi:MULTISPECIES: hypothetical protein [Clostridium]|uniref:hypothetical protein n=1 Tax=Clostridium TaxID=1485 RepID=UPI0018990057|nr:MULTISPECIES: hypothetical protein [Clostridium]MCR1952308.1 hypothetical protein [Clostridium sp. DSM 100503]MDI9216893.1 hypothetical protein [Clostridium tertium]